MFRCAPLFQRIMFILECHAFRLPVRRFILDMFDKDVMRQIVLDEEWDDETESQPVTAEPILLS